MTVHTIHSDLLSDRVAVILVGAGGNGSQMLTGLARLHLALRAIGHPGGLAVQVWDPDLVTTANVGRQLFSPSDVGQPKACVLVHRLNVYYGLDWRAVPARFTAPERQDGFPAQTGLLITCVDSAKARREIFKACNRLNYETPKYWLDLGNRQRDGQVVLGQFEAFARNAKGKKNPSDPARLPHVIDIFPELLEATFQEDDAPSCSLAESLERQDLFINQACVTWGLNLLWTLFRYGRIEHHGYLINLESGRVNPLPVP